MKHSTKRGLGAVASSIIAVLLASAAGLCCCSGLLVIPTATTVGEGQYSYEYQTDGVIQGIATDTSLFNNEIGIGKRLEVGSDIDADNSSSRLIGNAKYVTYGPDADGLALAVGVAGVANHLRPTPYVVSTIGTGITHLHLGTMRIDGSNRCIAGFDRSLGKLTLMCDYTSGSEAFSSLGFNYQSNAHFAIMAGVLFPNEDGDTRFTVHFVFCQSVEGNRS